MGPVRIGDQPVIRMGVAVNETGRQGTALRIHHSLCRTKVLTNGSDLTIQHSQIGNIRFTAGTVKNLRIFDKQIKHGRFLHPDNV